jgi:hypothetical protein
VGGVLSEMSGESICELKNALNNLSKKSKAVSEELT